MDPRDPRYRVPVPGLQQPQGSGDLLKSLANLLGFRQPCSGCEQRQRQMNQTVQFVPPGWPYPPRR